MKNHLRPASLTLVLVAMALAAPAQAVQFDWTGEVTLVEEDLGGLFSGAGVGASFKGSHTVPAECIPSVNCFVETESDEANYDVFGPDVSAFVMQGLNMESGDFFYINIQNDHALTSDEAILASLLLGETVDPGTVVDVWTIGAGTNDVLFDDITDELLDGGIAEVFFVSIVEQNDIYDDLSYRAFPPSLGDVNFAGFNIQEGDGNGLIYSVFGELETASAVPEPGLALLMGTGLLAFGLGRRR